MDNKLFKVILLVALPASGKSELREFLNHMPKEKLRDEFHIGETVQLDDFPYVHFMRCIDNELEKLNQARIFYEGETPFIDGRDWGTLCSLLNEDYKDLLSKASPAYDSASELLFERIDRAAEKAGIAKRLSKLDKSIRKNIAKALEQEAEKIMSNKRKNSKAKYQTVVIECARGGPQGANMPLHGTFGYQYSLPMFSDEILKDASVLYIWVTPEESRRKNNERANPEDPGSNLHHGVPEKVMLGDYGCDDMQHLINESPKEGAILVNAHGKDYFLPIGVFDNRVDRTSFLRNDPKTWKKEDILAVDSMLKAATDKMFSGT
jgi:hypothetical protein